MNTLTLDLGTNTGWAILKNSELHSSGTIQLASEIELANQRKEGKERTLDVRFTHLYSFLAKIIPEQNLEQIVFEDVQFSSTQMQGQLWASLRTAIWAIAQIHTLRVFSVPVGTLKKFATGSGAAQKDQMIDSLKLKIPGTQASIQAGKPVLIKANSQIADDNEVDAIWLAFYTQAVEAGSEDFLGVYQRKQMEKEAKRKKKSEKRAEIKAKKTQALALARALPKCCGVMHVLLDNKTAQCPKCQTKTKL
jgi:Holliday junction resolvasome RuvABC endonuclease subunit